MFIQKLCVNLQWSVRYNVDVCLSPRSAEASLGPGVNVRVRGQAKVSFGPVFAGVSVRGNLLAHRIQGTLGVDMWQWPLKLCPSAKRVQEPISLSFSAFFGMEVCIFGCWTVWKVDIDIASFKFGERIEETLWGVCKEHNVPPVALDAEYEFDEDVNHVGELSGKLPEDSEHPADSLTYQLVQNLKTDHARCHVFATGRFNCTLLPHWSGTEQFLFSVSDGRVSSSVAALTLNILPVADEPFLATWGSRGMEDTWIKLHMTAYLLDGDRSVELVIKIKNLPKRRCGQLGVGQMFLTRFCDETFGAQLVDR